MSFGARARIRLGALRHNLQVIKYKARDTRVMAVVKANAYGHGLIPVARALVDADCLAVARLSEARVLRDAGIDTPIMLLGGAFSLDDVQHVIDLRLQLCVHREEQIDWLEKSAPASIDIWLKIDTGMNRLGLRPKRIAKAIERLNNCAAVDELRLMTHLANADNTDDSTTQRQLELFVSLVTGFGGEFSIANSAAIFGWSDELQTVADLHSEGRPWIRPGVALYGISPFPDQAGDDLGLLPVMQFESQLIAIKGIRAGDRVGYGGTWSATGDTKIGLVAAGYGDGYPRNIGSGTAVIINGRQVPVVGQISMDMSAVDLGAGANDQVGDIVVLWGDELPVEEIACRADTIPYTLVSGITDRVERIYED